METDDLPIEIYISRAESHVEKGEFFQALENYQTVSDKGINSADVHQQMSILYYHLGFLDKAITSSEKALQIIQDNDYLHHNLGVLYFAQNNLVKSQEHFIKALKINPGSTNSHFYLAHTLFRQGLPDLARRFAHSARQLGHSAAVIPELSKEGQLPPLTVWSDTGSDIYLRQIVVQDELQSDDIIAQLREGKLFEDIAHLVSDSPNGGYSGGYSPKELQGSIALALSGKSIPSQPALLKVEDRYLIVQRIAPIDWQWIPSTPSATVMKELQSPHKNTKAQAVTQQQSQKKKKTPFAIQVGVFREFKYALQRFHKVKSLGYNGHITNSQSEDNPLYVVFAGYYANYSSAQRVHSNLANRGIESFIIARP